MVFGFFKHMSEYFTSKKRKRKNNCGSSDSEEDLRRRPYHLRASDWIPLYDTNRQVIGYIQPETSQTSDQRVTAPRPIISVPEKWTIPSSTNQANSSTAAASKPIKQPKFPTSHNDLKWDGWPDGEFERDFSFSEVEETKHLQVHWACVIMGGDRKGDKHASTWQSGKRGTRRCLGVLECNNPDCEIVVRPQTTPSGIASQLEGLCKCGGELEHFNCGVRSTLWTWSGGIHYINNGYHEHKRPSYLLHLLKNEERRFEALVKTHPKVGPLGLIVGIPGIDGPGESVADISDVLLNSHRVAQERLKIVSNKKSDGDDFIARFAQFDRDHPGFVISRTLGEVTVISLQSSLMRSQLLRKEDLDGPLNGMVNDAAHGWWKTRTSLLMISSTYCPALLCWVPGAISFTNGATAEHFKWHFLAVFDSIEEEAKKHGIPITDLMFRGIMDFSDAERGGFILAFVIFWTKRGDQRTELELARAAAKILRGCRQHFRNNIVRVSRISAIVPPAEAEGFKARAAALLDAPDSEEFLARVKILILQYPGLESWIAWYMRPAHAQMLFSSERSMDAVTWDSMPATTNAEEAMHWKFYAGFGRDHDLFEGLECIFKAAVYYDRLYEATSRGVPIRHGQAEVHKIIAQHTGTTKPSRQILARKSHKKSDGRGPDTSKELLKAMAKKRKAEAQSDSPRKRLKAPIKSKQGTLLKSEERRKSTALPVVKIRTAATSLSSESVTSSPFPEDPISLSSIHDREKTPLPSDTDNPLGSPSYPWNKNSCWLDTSLQLFYVALQNMGIDEFENLCKNLPADSGIRLFSSAILTRRNLADTLTNAELSKALHAQRDKLRRELRHRRVITELFNFESLTPWLYELVNRDSRQPNSFRQSLFFQCLLIDIHACSGSMKTGGRHIEITDIPRRARLLQVNDSDFDEYHGNMTYYMDNFFSIEHKSDTPDRSSCWRTREGIPLCDGERLNKKNIVISVPVMLTIEIILTPGEPAPIWNFPATLYPDSSGDMGCDLVYDLTGLALAVNKREHFIARYASRDGNKVYTYDGMGHGGHPILEINATAETHLFGSDIIIPKGADVHQAFYYLRGGLKAQERFYESRTAALAQNYPLTFSRDSTTGTTTVAYSDENFVPMDKKHRYWMRNPYKEGTTEYLSRSAPALTHAQRIGTPEPEDTPEPLSSPQPLPSSPQPPSSLPDSLFSINCRCGMTGDGNIAYLQDDGEAIQCDRCKDWSHIACQRHGRADMLRRDQSFVCDSCDQANSSSQRRTSRRTASRISRKPLAQRLRAGCSVLAQKGVYWYPARLIQREESGSGRWRVRWWRGCTFEDAHTNPGSISSIAADQIIDSLWQDRASRRKIRLGKWAHAVSSPPPQAIVSDPSSFSYTPEVELALAPSLKVLQQLLTHPDEADSNKVPAKRWLEQSGSPLATTRVCHAGSLSSLDKIQIANWFEAKVSKETHTVRSDWTEFLPLVHAYTLYIAHRLASTSSLDGDLLLERAWEVQLSAMPQLSCVDVDQESLADLEEQMFERSLQAGVAGYFQWGLDVGGHQDGWDPYTGLPSTWNHGDREENEAELQVGPDYIPVVSKSARLRSVKEHPSVDLYPLSPLGPVIDEETIAKLDAISEKMRRRDAKREAREAITKASLRCRCGASGAILDDVTGLPLIQCTKCGFSSHVACQRHGRAGDPRKASQYVCDICLNPYNVQTNYHIPSTRGRKPALVKRLQPGKGALSRFGKYWFPVRLLYKNADGRWRVKWHPSCEFGDTHPDVDGLVKEEDLVDELWQEQKSRRMIRLGKWTHENDLKDEDDVLLAFRDFPYTNEIDGILSPHVELLSALIDVDFTRHPSATSSQANELLSTVEDVPVVKDIRNSLRGELTMAARTRLTGGLVTDFGHGPIDSVTHARILNWFWRNVPDADETRLRWSGCVPDAHALTIYYASKCKDELIASQQGYPSAGTDIEKQTWLLNAAWDYQSTPRPISRIVNVDNECLRMLEERMFENSKRAGIAGNQQWGLDVGSAKGRWNPYETLPPSWNHNDRVGDDSEDIRGDDFSEGSEDDTQEKATTMRRPTYKPKYHTS